MPSYELSCLLEYLNPRSQSLSHVANLSHSATLTTQASLLSTQTCVVYTKLPCPPTIAVFNVELRKVAPTLAPNREPTDSHADRGFTFATTESTAKFQQSLLAVRSSSTAES